MVINHVKVLLFDLKLLIKQPELLTLEKVKYYNFKMSY